MPARSSGVIGSALATALLGTLLYRPAPTSPSCGPETGLSRAAPPATKGLSKKKSNAQTRSPAKKQTNGTLAGEGPWIASQQHFAGLAPTPGCTLRPFRNDLQKWCIPPDEQSNIKALIAVIPDPVQTRLALRFDRAVDAIELAAESMHYVIDRYWLPWELDPKTDWADYASFKEEKKDRETKERQPGLMMFRWDADPKRRRLPSFMSFWLERPPPQESMASSSQRRLSMPTS